MTVYVDDMQAPFGRMRTGYSLYQLAREIEALVP